MNSRSLKYKLFVVLLVLCFVSTSYAIVEAPLTYDAFMAMTSAGASKIASAGASVGSKYLLARLALGASVVGGVVSLGIAAYDGYNMYQDYKKVNVTLPSQAAGSKPAPANMVSSWGIESSLYCDSTVYENLVPSTFCGYSVSPYQRQLPGKTQITTGSGNLCSPSSSYIIVGGYHTRQVGYTPVYASCAADLTPYDYPLVTNIIRTFYSLATNYPAPTATISEGSAPSTSSNTDTNTQTILDSIDAVRQQIKTAQTASKSSLTSDGISTTPYGDVLNRLGTGNGTNVMNVVQGTDYNIRSDTVPISTTVNPNTVPDGETSGDSDDDTPLTPPTITNGQCSEYVPSNSWQTIQNKITAGLATVPLMGLVNTVSNMFTAADWDGILHLSIDNQFMHVSSDLNLNDWYLAEALLVIRWSIIAASFMFAWRLAIGGE